MFLNRSLIILFLLATLTVSGYALATIGMHFSSNSFIYVSVAIILLGLGGTIFAEMSSFTRINQSSIYLSIILGESALVLGYMTWTHDGITLIEVAGAAIVAMGSSLVSVQS